MMLVIIDMLRKKLILEEIQNSKTNSNMSKRYSGKSFKDSSVMKKAKLTLKEKRKAKREKKKNNQCLGKPSLV